MHHFIDDEAISENINLEKDRIFKISSNFGA